MYVCICNAITETELRESVAAGASTFEELQLDTGVASCCGTCVDAATAVLAGNCPGPAACGHAVAAAATPAVPAGLAPVRWVSRAPHHAPLPRAA